MTGTWRFSWLVIVVLVGGAGCAEYRAVDDTQQTPDPAYCAFCHGSVLEGVVQPGPPLDTLGNFVRLARGVGAHEAHLVGGGLSAPVPCETCHRVPVAAADTGHMDDPLPAETRFSGLALAGGAKPVAGVAEGDGADDAPYSEFSVVTCSSVYCHGATLSGGLAIKPAWNGPEGDLAKFSACDACHGFPPPAPHPDSPQCADCHGDVVSADGTFVDPTRHVDGTLDVTDVQSCTACHGYPPPPPHPESSHCIDCHDTASEDGGIALPEQHQDGQVQVTADCNACHGNVDNPAPPKDLSGSSDTSLPTVGAHQEHLLASSGLSGAVACEECHLVPDAFEDAGHVDGDDVAEVLFGSLSRTGGLNPAWSAGAANCTNTWCHGATLAGGSNNTPKWTTVDGTQDACGSCHGIDPGTDLHPGAFGDHAFMGQNCNNCHQGVANSGATAIEDTVRHINGTVDVVLQAGLWDPVARTCTPACHGEEGWEVDE